jgi:hypothetical protein
VYVISEVAREVHAKGFPLNLDATVDTYYNCILAQLQAERNANKRYVLADRCLVDLLAYLRFSVRENFLISSYFVEMVEELVWLESQYFNCFCYLPIEFSLIADGIRSENLDFQSAVDREIRSILESYNLPFQPITGNLEERKLKVINLVEHSWGFGGHLT